MGYIDGSTKLVNQPLGNTKDAVQAENDLVKSTPLPSQAEFPNPRDNLMKILVDRTRDLNYNIPDAVIPTNKETSERPHQGCLGISFATFGDVIVQDGEMTAKLRTKYFSKRDGTPISDLKGQISKTRLFGQSHWMHAFNEVPIPKIITFSDTFAAPRALSRFLIPILILKESNVMRFQRISQGITWIVLRVHRVYIN